MLTSYKLLFALLAGLPVAASVSLSGTSLITGPSAGGGTVSIVADQAWTASSSDTWLTVSPASGSGNQVLTFSYTANAAPTGRMATITVTGKQFVVSQLAANGSSTRWGAVPASSSLPEGVGVDGNGNIYIPDAANHLVRKLSASTGLLTTIAGTGAVGSLGDGGLATAATLQTPRSVAIDSAGNVFIADDAANRVRRIDAITGVITAFAGTGLAGSGGDGGAATSAQLSLPYGVAVDTNGSLYIADLGNHRIRKVTAGIMTTIAGTGTPGYGGDGAAATSALLFNPTSVAVDGAGNVFIADSFNHRIRKVTFATSFISTVAGTGTAGFGGDTGAATAAQLDTPRGVAVDPVGDLYIADSNNQRVRKVTVASGVINTFASTGLANPSGVAVDGVGHVYVGDTSNNQVLFFNYYTPSATLASGTANVSGTAGSGNVSFTIAPAGGAWTAASSTSWLTLGTSGGTGAGALTYNYTDNPGIASRTGVIVINGATYTVTQAGPSLSTSSAYVTPGASSGTFSLTVPPSVGWTAVSSASWLTVAPPSGTGSATLTFTFAANAGAVGRMATITVAGRTFAVSQPAANGTYTPWGALGNGQISTLFGSLNGITGVTADGNGNVYVTDGAPSVVHRIDAITGAITTVATNPPAGSTTALAVDRAGNVYVSSFSPVPRVFKIAGGTGGITTIAGGGGIVEDGGLANAARLFNPYGIAVDVSGNVFVVDADDARVRRIDAVTGIITTVAGNRSSGFSGDGGPAVLAQLSNPVGLALDSAGNLYIGDTLNHRVRRVDANTGIITTFAGTGTPGFGGDGGPATSALLSSPRGLAMNAAGDLFISDRDNRRIRKVSAATGIISTVVGFGGVGTDALTSANLLATDSIALDPAGNLLIADSGYNRLRFVDFQSPVVSLSTSAVAVSMTVGTGSVGISTVPAGSYWAVTSSAPWLTPGVTGGIGSTLDYSFADNPTVSPRTAVLTINGQTLTVRQSGATVSTSSVLVGPAASSGTLTLTASPSASWSATSSDSWLTIAPPGGTGSATLTYTVAANAGVNGRMAVLNVAGRTVSISQSAANGSYSGWGVTGYGVIKTIAGTGTQGFTGDGGAGTAALLNFPYGAAVDGNGNLYIADFGNNRVRKVAAGTGIITAFAGTGTAGFSGDGGSGTLALLRTPQGIAVDIYGNVYVADSGNHRVRRISSATGIITTVAGTGTAGLFGDNGLATAAQLNNPYAVAVGGNGDVFIADANNKRIRKVDAATGIITSVGLNIAALGVAVDGAGNVFASDYTANRIRRIDGATGVDSVFAGIGVAGFAGDGGLASAAQINSPRGLAVDAAGNVYIADYGNSRIRVVSASTNTISTLAGTGTVSGTGDGGPAVLATVAAPQGVAVDGGGNVYIADTGSHRIRFIDYSSITVTLSASGATAPSGGGSGSVTVTSTNAGWTVTGAPVWLTVTRVGAAVNWTAAANTTGAIRSATLTIGDKSYTVTQDASAAVAPVLVSVTPAVAATASQTFTISARDGNGYTDIGRIYFLLNSSTAIPANSCHGFYDRAANAVFLYNDALTGTSSPLTPGVAGTVQNSQCAISGAGSSVSGSGTDVVLDLALTRQGAYASGALNLYFWVTDNGGLGTGWVAGSAWTVSGSGAQPPTVASATPATATAATQTFTMTARDANGYADIGRIYFLVNSSTAIPTNTCHGFYDRAANGIYLYNDGLTALSGPLTPGGAGSIANSQCSINGAASSVSGSGTDVVLGLNLTRQGAAATGSLNLYFWVTDNEATGTGWVQASTWTVGGSGPQPPTLAAASPTNSAAVSQVFSLTARDANGYSDIGRIYFLLNTSTAVTVNSCHGFYDRAANLVFLYDDALASTTSLAPGASGTIQNGNCAIGGTGTSVSASGTDVVLTLNIARTGAYSTGTRNLYAWVTDNEATGTGWVQASAWTISGGAPQQPVVVSASPSATTSLSQSFSLLFRDASGYPAFGNVYFTVNTNAAQSPGTCSGYYVSSLGRIYLYNDAQTATTSLVPGVAGTIQNSQCAIDGAGSSVSQFGTDLALTLRITRQGAAATGIRTLFVMAGVSPDNSSGWIPASTWTIAPVTEHPPTLASASPSVSSASTQTFAVTARDLDGYANINRVYFQVNANPTLPVGSCHGYYDRALNAIYLFDNTFSSISGPLTPGLSGTIQNSQCAINGAASSVTFAGTDLTVNLNMTRTGSYASGALNLYIWVTDNTGAGSGFVQASSWTL